MNASTWRFAWESKSNEMEEMLVVSRLLHIWPNYTPRDIEIYKMYGSFVCPKDYCDGKWTSTQCTSSWEYWFDPKNHQGQVELVKEYRQQCRECESWAPPCFDEESTGKAVNIIMTRLKRVFCAEAPDINSNNWHTKAIARQTPHDSERCEACQEGICPQNCFLGEKPKEEPKAKRARTKCDHSNDVKEKIKWNVKLSDTGTYDLVIGEDHEESEVKEDDSANDQCSCRSGWIDLLSTN